MENKFVIWGCGFRGKYLFDILGKNNVAAFIDQNTELVGTEYKGTKIVDFDSYLEEFNQYFIIVSLLEPEAVEIFLKEHNINSYFLLTDCPEEFQGYGDIKLLEKSITEFVLEGENAIYGINLFSVLLYYFIKNRARKVYLVPEKTVQEEKLEEFNLKFPDIPVGPLKESTNVLLNTKRKDMKKLVQECRKELKIENAYDFSDKMKEYYHKNIENYKGMHKGKRCFIVATGPSLTIDDLNVLKEKEEICFSMNRIYCVFEKTEWRPDYYVVADRKIIENYWKDILELEVKDKFISDKVLYLFGEKRREECLNSTLNLFHEKVGEAMQGDILFSEDFAKRSYWGWTVTYFCLQLAVYMGISEIYLLGVDCNYITNGSNQDHFCDNYIQKGKEHIPANVDGMRTAYQVAKQYAEENNIKIYNATRGGKLEIFERVDFDSLFQ